MGDFVIPKKKEALFELFLVYIADSRGISIKCQKCRLVFPTFTDSFCDYVHYISAHAYYVRYGIRAHSMEKQEIYSHSRDT